MINNNLLTTETSSHLFRTKSNRWQLTGTSEHLISRALFPLAAAKIGCVGRTRSAPRASDLVLIVAANAAPRDYRPQTPDNDDWHRKWEATAASTRGSGCRRCARTDTSVFSGVFRQTFRCFWRKRLFAGNGEGMDVVVWGKLSQMSATDDVLYVKWVSSSLM